jgi:hypothetical protein
MFVGQDIDPTRRRSLCQVHNTIALLGLLPMKFISGFK